LVDAGKEIEVLVDREIVVERKLLGHVAELLPDVLRTQLADLACQSHLARAGRQQATEHLDRGGLARTVGAEQSEDLAVAHLEIDALDRDEVAECLAQAARADRHRITDRLATVAVRKWRNARLALEAAQDPDERVLERRRRGPNAADRVAQRLTNDALAGVRVAHQHVEAIAEALDIGDPAVLRQP